MGLLPVLDALLKTALPPWVKWLGALLLVLAIALLVYAYGEQQYGRGMAAEKARWLARENAELVAANYEIARLSAKKAALEAASERRVAEAASQFLKERRHEQAKTHTVIRDLRNGDVGLWYALASSKDTSACPVPEVGSAASGGDGGTEAELPRAIAEALYLEADRADGIARQLEFCQQVILEDRRLCGK